MNYAATPRIGVTFAAAGTVAPRPRIRQAGAGGNGWRGRPGAGAGLAARPKI